MVLGYPITWLQLAPIPVPKGSVFSPSNSFVVNEFLKNSYTPVLFRELMACNYMLSLDIATLQTAASSSEDDGPTNAQRNVELNDSRTLQGI